MKICSSCWMKVVTAAQIFAIELTLFHIQAEEKVKADTLTESRKGCPSNRMLLLSLGFKEFAKIIGIMKFDHCGN